MDFEPKQGISQMSLDSSHQLRHSQDNERQTSMAAMNLADQTALWDVCQHQWRRVELRLSKVKLPHEDWRDLKAEAMARVFQRAAGYDPTKGVPEAWARTVMYRSALNGLRRILPNPKIKSHKWRANVRLARPLSIRVKQTGRWGEKIVVVEPDTLDHAAECPRTASLLPEFLSSLRPCHRHILNGRLKGHTFKQIHHRHFRRSHTYQWTWARAQELKHLWRDYRDQPFPSRP